MTYDSGNRGWTETLFFFTDLNGELGVILLDITARSSYLPFVLHLHVDRQRSLCVSLLVHCT